MGCFLQCFGLASKRKRRKTTLYKVLTAEGDQIYGNYEVLAITEKSIIPYSDIRGSDQLKEQKNGVKSKKKKKKVTFNLNVQIYEPNPNSYQVLDDNEDEENKYTTTAEPDGSAGSTINYPSNHRYSNCIYDYDDEEDEITYDESDIDDDDEFDDWDYDDGCDESLENDDADAYDENSKQKENQKPLAPNDAELKFNLSGRERSTNMHSVLIPVENLTQWKAIKAKVTSSKQKHRRKENVQPEQNTSMPSVYEASLNFSPSVLESNALQAKPLLQEIAVDASLSNWLVSPNYNVSTTIRCQ